MGESAARQRGTVVFYDPEEGVGLATVIEDVVKFEQRAMPGKDVRSQLVTKGMSESDAKKATMLAVSRGWGRPSLSPFRESWTTLAWVALSLAALYPHRRPTPMSGDVCRCRLVMHAPTPNLDMQTHAQGHDAVHQLFILFSNS